MQQLKIKYSKIFSNLNLRNLETNDKNLLYKWRNMKNIILLSSTQKNVNRNEHTKWFNNVIKDKEILIFIIEKSLVPIGKIQFKKIGKKKCLFGIYLIGKNIGLGMGPYLIHKSCRIVFKRWKSIHAIEAEIRKENKRSFYAFKKAGFKNVSETNKLKENKIDKLVLYRN